MEEGQSGLCLFTYEISKNIDTSKWTIFQICLTIGQIETFISFY